MLVPLIRTTHCAPKHSPCPQGGKNGVRVRSLENFSGALGVDELHLGRFTLLIVQRQESLRGQECADLGTPFRYLPWLQTLWRFSQEVYKVWGAEQSRKGGAVAVDAAEEQRRVPEDDGVEGGAGLAERGKGGKGARVPGAA